MNNLFTLDHAQQITDAVATSMETSVTKAHYIDTAMDIIEPGFDTVELELALAHPRTTKVEIAPDGSLTIDLASVDAPVQPVITVAKTSLATRYDNTGHGVRGISATASGKFRADITRNGYQINLGTYDTFQEAVEVRMAAQWGLTLAD